MFMWNKEDLHMQRLQMRMQMLQGRNMHLWREMHMLLQVRSIVESSSVEWLKEKANNQYLREIPIINFFTVQYT